MPIDARSRHRTPWGRRRAATTTAPSAPPEAISVRAAAASAFATAMVMLPVFLTSAHSVAMRRELGFDEAGLGVAVSSFFGASAASSVVGGWLAQRWGAGRCATIGSVTSLAATMGVPLVASRLYELVALLVLAGAANAIVQPAASLVLAQEVPRERQGLAFGINQVSAPLAAALAGVTTPIVGLTVGWRWAFATPLLLAAVVAVTWPRGRSRQAVTALTPDGKRRVRWLLRHPALLTLTAATALGSTASQALVAFFVESAVHGGMSPVEAGSLLGAGSMCGLVARLFWGWLADRRNGTGLLEVVVLMAVGSLGIWGLATTNGFLLPAATCVAFAAGWGWNGLLSYVVVRHHPSSPALALGVASTGVFVGGVLGPLGFGFVARHTSYPFAWTTTAVVLALASLLVLVAARIGLSDQPAPTAASRRGAARGGP